MLTQAWPDRRDEIGAPEAALVMRFSRDLAALEVSGDARLALAVSGGGDSLALLLLAAAARPGLIHAATVDHRLRHEAVAEAGFVAGVCARLGIPHAILTADTPPVRNLQAAARTLRYRLLGEWAAIAGCDVLLTAHQLDDQAETLLMRLTRGSGVGGLAGIRSRRPLARDDDAIMLVRPLLGWRRAELRAIVGAAGIEPVCDPSNEDRRFDRARLRAELASTDWLDPTALARSAAALADAETALDWAADAIAHDRVDRRAETTRLRPDGLPDELLRRLVLRVIAGIDPDGSPPRGDSLDRLVRSLRADHPAMLGDVLATPGPIWSFAPAPPRRSR